MHDRGDIFNEAVKAPIHHISFSDFICPVSILRLDLLSSWASGNKYFKLKYPLQHAIGHGLRTIVSKGGMFSNHLEALSQACSFFNMHCVCIIRSYQIDEANPIIKTLRARGAELQFLQPDEYKMYDEKKAEAMYPGCYFIPEGGASDQGIKGAAEIMPLTGGVEYSHIIIAGGTLSTAAGMISAEGDPTNVIIIPAWKGCTIEYVEEFLTLHKVQVNHNWDLWPEYHFGGFGKYNPDLVDFMMKFTLDTSIPLDPVYTGKMMFALNDKFAKGYFNSNDNILCVHTGGLQGIAGYVYRDPLTWGAYPSTHFSITRG